MEKYIFKNYRTRRFSQKTFEGQSDYFVVADLYRTNEPDTILEVVAFWGTGEEEEIMNSIAESKPLAKKYYEPFAGEFVSVPSSNPLYRIYKEDDFYLGRCSKDKVGTCEYDKNGNIKIYNSIEVFCIINPAYIRLKTNPITKDYNLPSSIPQYQNKWEPECRALHKMRYCYVEIKKETTDYELPF